ncbi:MAG: PAS domain-containing sensor histidine kinase [Pseudomonadota bacterium]
MEQNPPDTDALHAAEFGIPAGDETGVDMPAAIIAAASVSEAPPWLRPMGRGAFIILILGLCLSVLLSHVTQRMTARIAVAETIQWQNTIKAHVSAQNESLASAFNVIQSADTGSGDIGAMLDTTHPKFKTVYSLTQGSHDWRATPILPIAPDREQMMQSLLFEADTATLKQIVRRLPSQRFPFFLVPIPFLPRDIAYAETLSRDTPPFAAARTVIKEGQKQVWVIVTSWSELVGASAFSQIKDLVKLRISLPQAGNAILVRDSNDVAGPKLQRLLPFHIGKAEAQFSMYLGDSEVAVYTQRLRSPGQIFVSLSPFLVGGLGIFFTLFLTLYAMRQRRKLQNLGRMNDALRAKNTALHQQIKETHRLQAALRRNERETQSVINAVSDVIFELDSHGVVQFVNTAWKNLTGIAAVDVTGKALFDFMETAESVQQAAMYNALITGQRSVYKTETILRCADGTPCPVLLSISMLRLDEDGTLRAIGTLTARNGASLGLETASSPYKALWDNAPIGIYQMTPHGRLLTINSAYARILGYEDGATLQSCVKQGHIDLYAHPKDRLVFLQSLPADGAPAKAEFTMIQANGSHIWVAESVRIIQAADGSVACYEGTIEDVTALKETYKALEKAKWDSDMASRAKTEFLSNIGHELRTPLNSVIGFSEIIRNQALGPIENNSYVDYAGDILESGKRLLKVINQILDIARVEGRERQLNEGIVRMPTVVHSCLDLLRYKIADKNLQVENLIDPDLPDIVGEELAARQMMFNLISNAVKFTPEGGRITISALVDPLAGCRISVSDTGTGLDEAEVMKALTPFGLVETGHARENYGIGLGLTLVKMLIEMHEGELDLFSQKGVGTTASVIYPPKRVRERATRLTPSFDVGRGAALESEAGAGINVVALNAATRKKTKLQKE